MEHAAIAISIAPLSSWPIRGLDWSAILMLTGSVLWLSTFGYCLTLLALKQLHKRASQSLSIKLPTLALIIPVLNESRLIRQKMENLLAGNYPLHLMRVLVLDGGSKDDSIEKLERYQGLFPQLEIHQIPEAQARSDQINRILDSIQERFVVFTDVDALLEPDCIAHLIEELSAEPTNLLVGALVEPVTPLLEEKIHWWFLSRLWWLEGEALNSSRVSGVCYACRKSLLGKLPRRISADDIHLSLRAMSLGGHSRICHKARAHETRTPANLGQMLAFRCKRGKGYIAELTRSLENTISSLPNSLCSLIHLWHFRMTPLILALYAISIAMCLFTQNWVWPCITLAAIIFPYLSLLLFFRRTNLPEEGYWRVIIAGVKLVLITSLSTLALMKTNPYEKQ